jgi:hypothetical protein
LLPLILRWLPDYAVPHEAVIQISLPVLAFTVHWQRARKAQVPGAGRGHFDQCDATLERPRPLVRDLRAAIR